METLKNFLWPIVAIGGIGAFIDFLIGKAGQEKARDFLLKWWIRFDDVRWRNFGREEGFFAGLLIERWFGKRIWSLRRIAAACIIFVLSLPIVYLLSFNTDNNNISCYYCYNNLPKDINSRIVWLIIIGFYSVLYFSGSISFLKFITLKIATICGVGQRRNLLLFLLLLTINYLMLIYVSPSLAGMRETAFANISEFIVIQPSYAHKATSSLNYYVKRGEIDRAALFLLACFPSIIRFGLSLVFVGSFLLRPIVMRPMSLLWARIIESEKPVFTVTFGEVAAFASALGEAAKHL
jgi:hypothetical protein